MSTTKTTRGSFDIHIRTDGHSEVRHKGEVIAYGHLGNKKFNLSKEAYIVDASLLRELSDVLNEADRLLAEARAAVSRPQSKGHTIATFEPAPAKSKARIRFEQGVAFLNSITAKADKNERKTLAFKTDGGHFIGVKRAGVWSFYQSNGSKKLKSWGTLADNTKRDGLAIAHLDGLTELSHYGSENPTNLHSHRVWYDGKTTVYRYIPVDDRYVAFDFNVTKDKFPVIGDFVNNTDLIPNRFEWDKDTGWQIETAINSPSTFADAIRAYLRPAPVEYALDTTNSMTFNETGGSVPISAYYTYNPEEDITTYSYWVPTTGKWETYLHGSGKTWYFKDRGVASPTWTTEAPYLSDLVRDGNAHYNLRVINNAMGDAPVAFFKTKDGYVFSVNRNSDATLSAFHICGAARRVDLYERSMAKGDDNYLPNEGLLTPITAEEAIRLRPGLSSLKPSLPDIILVPIEHFDSNGNFYQSRDIATYHQRTNGKWRVYNGANGTFKDRGENNTINEQALNPEGWKVVKEIPTPIGYRLFDTTKNKWTQSAKNGITLFATADGYTPMDGDELRPWYGPSLVTE